MHCAHDASRKQQRTTFISAAMPVGRTPPRRAFRSSGEGYGKREKKVAKPFSPEDYVNTKKTAGGRGGGGRGAGAKAGRGGGRGGAHAHEDVVNKVRTLARLRVRVRVCVFERGSGTASANKLT